MTSTTKRRALIIISSARQLPLSQPASVPSVSIGFFLVELAQVLKELEKDYEFTFATPDGNAPQLDINGMALAFHAIEKLGQRTATTLLTPLLNDLMILPDDVILVLDDYHIIEHPAFPRRSPSCSTTSRRGCIWSSPRRPTHRCRWPACTRSAS